MGMDKKLRMSLYVALIIPFIGIEVSYSSDETNQQLINFVQNAPCIIDDRSNKNEWIKKCQESPYEVSFTYCLGAVNESCNKLLDRTYDEAMKTAKAIKFEDYDSYNNQEGAEEQRLKNAQDAWLEFREAHCKVNVDFSGTGSRLGYSNCYLEQTKLRIKQLQNYYVTKPEGVLW